MQTMTVKDYTGRKFSVTETEVVSLYDFETGELVSKMTKTYFNRQLHRGEYTKC